MHEPDKHPLAWPLPRRQRLPFVPGTVIEVERTPKRVRLRWRQWLRTGFAVGLLAGIAYYLYWAWELLFRLLAYWAGQP